MSGLNFRGLLQSYAAEITEAYEGEGFLDWLNDNVLDYDYRCDSSHELESCRIWITLGGPNIWLDTGDKCLHGAWGTERVEWGVSMDICSYIEEYIEEMLRCEGVLK